MKQHIEATSHTCSGCTACGAVCPTRAISFSANKNGFAVPAVDEEACIGCGICTKICPHLSPAPKQEQQHNAYAVRSLVNEELSYAASGALFPRLAATVVARGGWVCGCVLDNLVAKHVIARDAETIRRMSDSKYVQSDMGDCIAEIVEKLRQGEEVLFTGTSCQVAGLKAAVRQSHVDDNRLTTLDFFCHGVPSPLVFKTYLEGYAKKYHTTVVDFQFRNKTYGWGKTRRSASFLSVVRRAANHRQITLDSRHAMARLWRSVFFSNLTLRPYCFQCPYSCVDKPADITMGDFWGVEQHYPHLDDARGVSLAITHNAKGQALLHDLEKAQMDSVSVEHAIAAQANAFKPCPCPGRYEQFWADFHTHGWNYVLTHYFDYTLKTRIKLRIKYLLFLLNLRNLY